MNPATAMTAAELERAIRREERLWPDPFEAPEVPPREFLERYCLGVGHLPHEEGYRVHLPDQIVESVNCRRALEWLGAQAEPGHFLHRLAQENGIPSGWAEFKARRFPGAEEPSPVRRPQARAEAAAGRPPEPDQIWTTRHRVEFFDGRDERWWRSRYTWQPVEALLAEGPLAADDDEIWRAMPCTPLAVWGEHNVGSQEAVVEAPEAGLYVVHFRLEYPVSREQFHACLGAVAQRETEPGKAPETAELRLERQRLFERALWLPATADARRLRAELKPKFEALDVSGGSLIRSRREGLGVARMGDLERSVMCLLWQAGMAALHTAVAGGLALAGWHEFTAQLMDAWTDRAPDGVEAKWRITDPTALARLREGDVFLVVKDGRISTPIGEGVVMKYPEHLLAQLETGRWGDFQGARADDLALLFPGAR
jgi:hypothetical protein